LGSAQAAFHDLEILQAQYRVVQEMYDRVHAERDELKEQVARLIEEKGRAEELLGILGAGGSAAGLVPAIHNLASMKEKLEEELKEARRG
jgi:hypothetical protein